MTERKFAALIRHGDYHQRPDTPSAHQPYGLTQTGRAQANDCAATLQDYAAQIGATIPPVLHSSHMRRAWETASLVAAHLPGEVSVASHDDLAERSVGAVANLTIDEIANIIADDPRYPGLPNGWKSDSHYCLPFQGAESLMQAGERVARYISQAVTAAPEGTLSVFVGHGASIRHGAHHLGLLDLPAVHARSMFHASPVIIELSSNGHWNHILGEWKLRSQADQPMD